MLIILTPNHFLVLLTSRPQLWNISRSKRQQMELIWDQQAKNYLTTKTKNYKKAHKSAQKKTCVSHKELHKIMIWKESKDTRSSIFQCKLSEFILCFTFMLLYTHLSISLCFNWILFGRISTEKDIYINHLQHSS